MAVYVWHGDEQYYTTVIDRYYRQVSFPLRLGAQAAIVWIIGSTFALVSNSDLATRFAWLVTAAVFGLAFPYLVKRGILMKYRSRRTFGAETTFQMTDREVLIAGPGAGRFPWTVYARAVAFSDGVMLIRKGGVRWLPHAALQEGTLEEVLAVVRSHLPTRVLA
ncbi:MAG TPA: hypothetical protein VFW40_07985 [Capsulimonadaceae bacterium]|nr:hypothetical protein [Capsulimonadaceae bacterium]